MAHVKDRFHGVYGLQLERLQALAGNVLAQPLGGSKKKIPHINPK